MECKKCGTTVGDSDIFCLQCGARLDGMKECCFCGKDIKDNAIFCSFCGKRLDGKTVCEKCGAEYAGNFCAQCGSKNQKTEEKKAKEKASTTFGNIEKYLTPALALGALFVLFICSFFIGVTLKIGEGQAVVASTNTTFDFFGKAFDNLNVQLESLKTSISTENYRAASIMLKMPYVVIAVMLGINLVVSTAMIIVASIKLGVGFYKKQEVRIHKFIAIAFASFFITAMIVYSAFVSISFIGDNVINMSGGSLAGLIISGVLVLGALVLRKIAIGMQGLNGTNICKTVCMLAIVVLSLIVGTLISKNFIKSSETVKGVRINGNVSTASYLQYGYSLVVGNMATTVQMNSTMMLSITSHFIYVFALMLIGLTIWFALSALFEKQTKKGSVSVLTSSILAISFIVVLMVMSIISANSVTTIDKALNIASTNRTAVIAPVILAVIMLAGSIVNRVFARKKNREMIEEF